MLMQEDKEIIRRSSVVGMTTTCAARYQSVLQEVGPRVIVVEEAAEVLEAHVITTLSKHCEHLILIGDHQQLKPSPTVYKLAQEYNLELSLFERIIKNNLEYRCLELQHRMRQEIAKIMQIIYPSLQNHDVVRSYDDIKGVARNVFFVDHSKDETSDEDSKSHSNEHEAKYIAALCRYLLLQGYPPDQITVLTMYSGQLFKLKQNMPKSRFQGVKITVVDNYQGEENDIVLLSLVRSNDADKIGFVGIENRICVALSRAKKGLFVIGNFELLARNSSLWKQIVKLARKEDFIGSGLSLYCQQHPTDTGILAVLPGDFDKASEGGCMKMCEFRLECGHTCTKACHVIDPLHEKFQCRKPCIKIVCDLQHKCRGFCSEPCPKCVVPVPKMIPKCGHTQDVPCSTEPSKYTCIEKCEKILECAHNCQRFCGESHTEICEELIKKEWLTCGHSLEIKCFRKAEVCPLPCRDKLACGHPCTGTCGSCLQGRFHKPCQQKCRQILICEHPCREACSICLPCKYACENTCSHSRCRKTCAEPCVPCREQCDWKCPHFTCTKMCFEPCNRPRCNERCQKILKCSHQCVGICGEPCPQYCRICHTNLFKKINVRGKNEEGNLYVQLENCRHLIERKQLDRLMDRVSDVNQTKPVEFPRCPVCKTLIRRSRRYSNVIKETRMQIEKIKKKMTNDTHRLEKFELHLKSDYPDIKDNEFAEFKGKIKELSSGKIPQTQLSVLENEVRFINALNKIERKYRENFSQNLTALAFIDEIRRFILKERKLFTKQVSIDVKTEFEKLEHLFRILKLKEEKARTLRHFGNSFDVHLKRAEEYIVDGKRFDGDRKTFVERLLDVVQEMKLVPRSSMNVQLVPMVELVEPPTPRKEMWRICPAGHTFTVHGSGITDKCPDCRTESRSFRF